MREYKEAQRQEEHLWWCGGRGGGGDRCQSGMHHWRLCNAGLCGNMTLRDGCYRERKCFESGSKNINLQCMCLVAWIKEG